LWMMTGPPPTLGGPRTRGGADRRLSYHSSTKGRIIRGPRLRHINIDDSLGAAGHGQGPTFSGGGDARGKGEGARPQHSAGICSRRLYLTGADKKSVLAKGQADFTEGARGCAGRDSPRGPIPLVARVRGIASAGPTGTRPIKETRHDPNRQGLLHVPQLEKSQTPKSSIGCSLLVQPAAVTGGPCGARAALPS